MEHDEEILGLAAKLTSAAALASNPAFSDATERLRQAAEEVGRASSNSWLGYQANVYYAGFRPPPPGAHFSSEWGMEELFSGNGTRGDWRELDPQAVRLRIHSLAGSPDLSSARQIAADCIAVFEEAKSEALSLLEFELSQTQDAFLRRLTNELDKLKPVSVSVAIEVLRPKESVFTRDMIAMGQGFQAPPHLVEIAEVIVLDHSVGICRGAGAILTKVGFYLERRRRKEIRAMRVGTNVFIGHGRSAIWRELKDFIQDRASLPWDEFNRVPIAGITNVARLSEMLDAAAIAFLIMTAEDEMVDGGLQARMNVIHEAGLFQGRLGFSKAIILLEEGCAEFSNVQGLGQIRFPKGRVSAAFEDVRQVLEREGLLEAKP